MNIFKSLWSSRVRRTAQISAQTDCLNLPTGNCQQWRQHDVDQYCGLIPVLIPAPYGRMGSTLLMEILGRFPAIAFERKPPYEVRYLTYFLHWAQMLGRRQANAMDWNAGKVFNEHIESLKPFPEDGDTTLLRLADAMTPLWARCFRAAWREFSGGMSDSSKYYAEKVPEWAHDIVTQLLPVRSLYLLRDPRDAWLSGLAFDAKRGYRLFGPRTGQSKSEHATNYALRVKPRLQHIIRIVRREDDTNSIFIKYEDLICDEHSQVARLTDWLGLTPACGEKSTDRGVGADHRTSSDPHNSLGRWRREMDAGIRQIFESIVGGELQQIGYDKSL